MNSVTGIAVATVLCFVSFGCNRSESADKKPDVAAQVKNCDVPDTELYNESNQVNWTATDDDYTLVFEKKGSNPWPKTPFGDQSASDLPKHNFPVKKNTTVGSGKAHVKGQFKYSVYRGILAGDPPASTTPCKDPGLHVKDSSD
jgi:hypothetical protein